MISGICSLVSHPNRGEKHRQRGQRRRSRLEHWWQDEFAEEWWDDDGEDDDIELILDLN